ncbi:MAG: response regulator [Methylococcales bacterium]|jgi:two-component system, sensor histidine kinase LadS|nr:response regulator [Methylococcales bacterium]MBT7408602.1 response regulator [Methylococcales bacterium]
MPIPKLSIRLTISIIFTILLMISVSIISVQTQLGIDNNIELMTSLAENGDHFKKNIAHLKVANQQLTEYRNYSILLIILSFIVALTLIIIHIKKGLQAMNDIHHSLWSPPFESSIIDSGVCSELSAPVTIINELIQEHIDVKKQLELADIRHKTSTKRHKELIENLEILVAESTEKPIEERDQARKSCESQILFLSNMSHEIRTPLTAVIGFAESIKDPEYDVQQKSTLVDAIIKNGNHLLHVVNEILDMSKIEMGRLELEKIPFSPTQLLYDLETITTALAREKKIQHEINLNFPLPSIIHSDPTRLKQILLNITSNAIKFTDTGKISLELNYNAKDQLIVFSIKDTGIGMTQQQIDKLFQPFSQADSSIARHYGGSGLGLYISIQLAEMLGGTINVESNISQGSQFNISIATGALENSSIMMSKAELTTIPTKDVNCNAKPCSVSGKILLAEDNPDNQHLISLLISKTGATLSIVNNGREAVDKALSEEFDLLLMDIQMPIMGGLEATKLLRSASYKKPIVTLTANVMTSEIETYLQAGCNGHISKPINRQQLYQIIHAYLQSDSPDSANNKAPSQLPQKEGKILYAEDNIDNQNIVRLLLKKKKIKLDIVENGKLALDKALKNDYDLILMDMQMPVMSGTEATEKLRSSGYKIPIVALTANIHQSDISKYKESGCTDWLSKPIDRKKFFKIIDSFIQPTTNLSINTDERATSSTHNEKDNKIKDHSDDPEMLALIMKFLGRIPKTLKNIDLALSTKNYEDLQFHAHSLKGTAGNFEFKKLSLIAGEIEAQLKQNNTQRLEMKTKELHETAEKIIEFYNK